MGAYDALPDLVGWGGDTPSRYHFLYRRLDLVFAPTAPRFLDLIPIKSYGYAYVKAEGYVVKEEGAPNDFLAGGGAKFEVTPLVHRHAPLWHGG